MGMSTQKAEDKMKFYKDAMSFFEFFGKLADPDKRKEAIDEFTSAFALADGLKKDAEDARGIISRANDHIADVKAQRAANEEDAAARSAALDKREGEINGLVSKHEDAFAKREKEIAVRKATLDSREGFLATRESEVVKKTSEFSKIEAIHSSRGSALDKRENDIKTKEIELAEREKAIEEQESLFRAALRIKK